MYWQQQECYGGSAEEHGRGTNGGDQTEALKAEDNAESRVLIAYFSRWGNTDYPEDIDATTSASIVADGKQRYGTTEYMAKMIQKLTGGELYLIQTKEAYSTDFQEVVDQGHRETDQDIIPVLKSAPVNMAEYDVVFVGYPVWAADVPRAIRSFLQDYDLTGKTVIPFCTHDGYGAGRSYATIAELCPKAETLEGLEVEAEDVPGARSQVEGWIRELGISKSCLRLFPWWDLAEGNFTAELRAALRLKEKGSISLRTDRLPTARAGGYYI